jgi:GTP-binding protein
MPCSFSSTRAPATTPVDRAFADLVRKSGKPAILVANKSEGRAGEAGALESYALGLGDPVAVSAEHGEGLADLYEALRAALPEATAQTEETDRASRPDSDCRGSTKADPHRGRRPAEYRQIDADQPFARRGAAADRPRSRHHARCDRGRSRLARPRLRIHDTAGLRRRSRVAEKLEKLSVADALNAIRFAEVVIVLVDAQAPFEEQDIRIADLVEREGRAIVIGINKVDLIERQPGVRPRLREEADRALPQVKGVPVVALVGEERRGARSADGGGDGGACGLEPPRADGRAQSFSGRRRWRRIRRRPSPAAAFGSTT